MLNSGSTAPPFEPYGYKLPLTSDSTQTSVQIPTFAGTTTISWAGEGLAPSEVELAYTKTK